MGKQLNGWVGDDICLCPLCGAGFYSKSREASALQPFVLTGPCPTVTLDRQRLISLCPNSKCQRIHFVELVSNPILWAAFAAKFKARTGHAPMAVVE